MHYRLLCLFFAVTSISIFAKDYRFNSATVSGPISEAQAIAIHRFVEDWAVNLPSSQNKKICLPFCLDSHNHSHGLFPLFIEFTTASYAKHLIERDRRLFKHTQQAIWCAGSN